MSCECVALLTNLSTCLVVRFCSFVIRWQMNFIITKITNLKQTSPLFGAFMDITRFLHGTMSWTLSCTWDVVITKNKFLLLHVSKWRQYCFLTQNHMKIQAVLAFLTQNRMKIQAVLWWTSWNCRGRNIIAVVLLIMWAVMKRNTFWNASYQISSCFFENVCQKICVATGMGLLFSLADS